MSEGVIRCSLCTAAPFSQTKSGRERETVGGGGGGGGGWGGGGGGGIQAR